MAFESKQVYSSCGTLAVNCIVYTNPGLTTTAPAGWYKIGDSVFIVNSSGVITSITDCNVTYEVNYEVNLSTINGGYWSVTNNTTAQGVSNSGFGNWTGSLQVAIGDSITVSVTGNTNYGNPMIAEALLDNSLIDSNYQPVFGSSSAGYTFTVSGNHQVNLNAYETV